MFVVPEPGASKVPSEPTHNANQRRGGGDRGRGGQGGEGGGGSAERGGGGGGGVLPHASQGIGSSLEAVARSCPGC